MRLSDLDPRWYTGLTGQPRAGITFLCPHCRETRLAVGVHADGANMDPEPDNDRSFGTPAHVWAMTGGDSWETLSLSPSVDASKSGHWHGFITNGEIR
jgi:hypothetical protein